MRNNIINFCTDYYIMLEEIEREEEKTKLPSVNEQQCGIDDL